jgi:uncharacterized membrane protein YeaQ/YmgE (transglycosylase-associated protein family)
VSVDIIMWVVVGLIVGWVAGSMMKGNGYGLAGDIAVAAVGAVVGARLIVLLVAEADRGGYGGPIVAGLVGAGAFAGLARLLTRRVAPA